MARITVEDCLQRVNNRFALVHMAAKRVRQLRKGAEPLVQSRNKDIVVSLREIASGRVSKRDKTDEAYLAGEMPDLLQEGAGGDDAGATAGGEKEGQLG